MVTVKQQKLLQARCEGEGRHNIVWNHIGNNWITHFLNRHPDLASNLAVRIDFQRVCANNKIIVENFHKLGKITKQEESDPKPSLMSTRRE